MKIRISERKAMELAIEFKAGRLTLSELIKKTSEYGAYYGRYSPVPRLNFQDKLANELKDITVGKEE